MAGALITVLPTRQLNFSGMQDNAVISFVLGRPIDVSAWSTVALLVRVYDLNSMGGTVEIDLQAASVSSDDPGLFFFVSTPIASVMLSSLNEPGYNPYPYVTVANATQPFGSHVRVVVKATSHSLDDVFLCSLGIQLCVKNGSNSA